MKSGKQRRAELKSRREAKRIRRDSARLLAARAHGVAVNREALRPFDEWHTPEFVRRGYYVDRAFRCKACGVEQVWTASQQKWWYEIAQGAVETIAVRCRPCRRRERERRARAQHVHFEGLERKRRLADQRAAADGATPCG